MLIFWPKRDENEEWRRLHSEELHSLYRSHYTRIGRMTKSRRLRWADHLVRKEEDKDVFEILKGKPTERDL